jgi:hypothetical protein
MPFLTPQLILQTNQQALHQLMLMQSPQSLFMQFQTSKCVCASNRCPLQAPLQVLQAFQINHAGAHFSKQAETPTLLLIRAF